MFNTEELQSLFVKDIKAFLHQLPPKIVVKAMIQKLKSEPQKVVVIGSG
jgi:hypothetical protein